ncbi:hypothetical protein [uncultured Fibrella sp.]|uniref:hypothetical protein n=1 Tax=uncultured Fibrella sp. TaxID=1284596 RepID=UPI0035CC5C83
MTNKILTQTVAQRVRRLADQRSLDARQRAGKRFGNGLQSQCRQRTCAVMVAGRFVGVAVVITAGGFLEIRSASFAFFLAL